MTEGYESLRAQATGSRSASPRGLALFLGSGLPAWLAAWRSLVSVAPGLPPVPPPRESAATFRLGPELAVLLAEMVLAGQRRYLS